MSIVTGGRDAATRLLFQDTVTIKRKTGTTFNPSTGTNTPTYSTLHSAISAHVRPMSGREVDAGEESLALHMYQVKVPYDTDGVRPEDVVDVTSGDGDLDGQSLVVVDVVGRSFNVTRTLTCRLNLE